METIMNNTSDIAQEPRTVGDGMDNSLLSAETTRRQLNIKINLKPNSSTLKSLKPTPPKSKVFHLVPKYVPKEQKPPKYLLRKPKEPKFVPYEPYKGAVEPIIRPKPKKKLPPPPPVRNNVEIQELVTQMSEFRKNEMNKAIENSDIVIAKDHWLKEKEGYENDIKNLRETNSHLENQLKFQAQVNSELKTLLVAAVGEDLETRVQHLTEDKLQLARALLNSANHLTSHQEQTEWLSGQCEVWRSKFLASSLMVEELARWKSALSNRMAELQEVTKTILEESNKINKNLSEATTIFKNIDEKHFKTISQETSNPTSNNLILSKNLSELSKKISSTLDLSNKGIVNHKQIYTNGEKAAIKLLQNPVTLSTKQDAICNAVLGAATSLCGQQMYLQHPSIHATCCAHCKGEIQNI